MRTIYQKPSVVLVELDPEQAILQVCQVGGAFFTTMMTTPYCKKTGGYGACAVGQRGVQLNANGDVSDEDENIGS